MNENANIYPMLPAGEFTVDPSRYKSEVSLFKIYCDENKFSILKTEYYSDSNYLMYMRRADASKVAKNDILPTSPFGVLRNISCNPTEVSK
jgi:hypothetical protein